MTTVAEVRHFASLLASLTVTAARATSREQLVEVHDVLAETFEDALMLLVHDGERSAESMVRDLLVEARSVSAGVRA